MIEQVPTETRATVLPDTVHTDALLEVNVTVRPKVAEATNATVAPGA